VDWAANIELPSSNAANIELPSSNAAAILIFI
jgi:hypothetical protein